MNLSPTKIFSLWCSSFLTHPNGSDAMYLYVGMYVCMLLWGGITFTIMQLHEQSFSRQRFPLKIAMERQPTQIIILWQIFSLKQEVYYIWPHLVSFSSQFFMAQILWWNVMQKYFMLPNLHLAICYVKVQKGVSKRKEST